MCQVARSWPYAAGGIASCRPDNRPGSTARGYDQEWKRIRSAFLADNPLCTECGAVATEVHHRIALRDGGTHAHSNLVPVCHSCHSRITAARDGGFGNPRKKKM